MVSMIGFLLKKRMGFLIVIRKVRQLYKNIKICAPKQAIFVTRAGLPSPSQRGKGFFDRRGFSC